MDVKFIAQYVLHTLRKKNEGCHHQLPEASHYQKNYLEALAHCTAQASIAVTEYGAGA